MASSNTSELQAMALVEQAMELLGAEERDRVLKWAGSRYVDTSWYAIRDSEREAKNAGDEALDAFKRFTTGLAEASRHLGMTPIDILKAASFIREVHEHQKVNQEAKLKKELQEAVEA